MTLARTADPYETRLRITQRICLGAYFSLLLVFFCKTVLLPMNGREANFTMWAVHSLPLLLFLPGMLRGNYRSYAWLAFAILMYFMLAVEALFTDLASIYHAATLVLVVVLFTCSALIIRWKGMQHQWLVASAGGEDEP